MRDAMLVMAGSIAFMVLDFFYRLFEYNGARKNE